jgi:type VI protein secretion system component VasK
VTPSTVDGMADLLGVLGGPTSPLKNLLDVITENTRLTQPAKAEAAADTRILAKGKSYADRLTTMFKQAPAAAAAPPSTIGANIGNLPPAQSSSSNPVVP